MSGSEVATLEDTIRLARERITASIRNEFVTLMGEDALAVMVRAELKRFTDLPPRGYHNDPQKPSPLSEMIQAEVRSIFAAQVKDAVGALDLQAPGMPGGASKIVTDFIAENLELIIQSAFASILQQAGWRIKNELQQTIRSAI